MNCSIDLHLAVYRCLNTPPQSSWYTMASKPTLPLEIIQLIINTLAEDNNDHTSLKACSLACQTLLHLCRKHIFASITLDGHNLTNPKPKMVHLINLISTTPEIADYIQQLEFYISNEEFEQPLLPGILKTITNLGSLTIRWPRFQRQWHNNPLRPAILHLLHLPTLIHLDLQDIREFIVSDLTPCTSLKNLRLSCIKIGETENQHCLIASKEPIRLQRLSVGFESSTALSKLSTAKRLDGGLIFDFTSLTSVSLTLLERDEFEASQGFLKLCNQLIDIDIFRKIYFHLFIIYRSSFILFQLTHPPLPGRVCAQC